VRQPSCPRQIDGVDERSLFGIVGAERSRGQRLRFGDLAIEIAGAQADELKWIEHEALVKFSLQECEARVRRVWRFDGAQFLPLDVRAGITDGLWTEVMGDGPLREGELLATNASIEGPRNGASRR